MLESENISEFHSFLGFANYRARYMPHFSTITELLCWLTRKGQPSVFGPEQKKAFDTLMRYLSDIETLDYFDIYTKLNIINDTSAYR